MLHLSDGSDDGYLLNPRCMGTYLHGILDNPCFTDYLLQPFADKLQQEAPFDYQAYKQQQYDLLADHIRRYVDIPAVYRILSRQE